MIKYNQFTEVRPDSFFDEEFEYKWEFKQDILQFRHSDNERILDLGWFPEFKPTGKYKIVLDWANIDILNNHTMCVYLHKKVGEHF